MSKIQSVKDYTKSKVLKIGGLTWIYDSDRISGATDMDTPTHGIGTPGYTWVKAHRNKGPMYIVFE
jgi:hypothetical protein